MLSEFTLVSSMYLVSIRGLEEGKKEKEKKKDAEKKSYK